MISRLGLAILVVVVVLGAAAPTAHSFVYSAQHLYNDDLKDVATRLNDFSDHPPEKGMGWRIYRQTEIIPYLTDEMIRDEHLVEVEAFGHNTTTVLPLLSAQMYLLYSRALHRHLQVAEAEEKSRIYRQLPGPGIPLMLKLLFPGYVREQSAVGLLKGPGARSPSGGASGILGWLFEDEGVFSGHEWSWDNFLPRILSVTALIVVGLLFIEFLRFLVLMGIRSIGNVDRRRS
ncbi:MAG: hypothetical protein KQI62_01650 [Deltaproteobacteria bacterium]|nr:hypothetical protein [Deltaproteobacteria bacterium]